MLKNTKNAAFYYKERKRMQRTPSSFIKNAKECKERKRMQERCVLLKRTHAQPCWKTAYYTGKVTLWRTKKSPQMLQFLLVKHPFLSYLVQKKHSLKMRWQREQLMREPCHFKVNQSENRIQEVGPIRRRTGYTQGGKMPNQSDKVPKKVGPIGKLVAYICT